MRFLRDSERKEVEEKLAEGVRLYEVDGSAAEREVRLNVVERVKQREQLAVMPVIVCNSDEEEEVSVGVDDGGDREERNWDRRYGKCAFLDIFLSQSSQCSYRAIEIPLRPQSK